MLEVVGHHDDVETAGIDGVAHHGFEIRRVARNPEKADLASLFQAVERLVNVRSHEAVDRVDGVDVGQVDIVGPESL